MSNSNYTLPPRTGLLGRPLACLLLPLIISGRPCLNLPTLRQEPFLHAGTPLHLLVSTLLAIRTSTRFTSPPDRSGRLWHSLLVTHSQTWRLRCSNMGSFRISLRTSCVLFLRVEFASLSCNLFWRTKNLHVFAICTVVVTVLQPPLAWFSDNDLDRAAGACCLLVCLCCDKDYVSKRLELLPFRNHSHMTPTRRNLCLTQHLYPRALPAQHSQRQHPRLS